MSYSLLLSNDLYVGNIIKEFDTIPVFKMGVIAYFENIWIYLPYCKESYYN